MKFRYDFDVVCDWNAAILRRRNLELKTKVWDILYSNVLDRDQSVKLRSYVNSNGVKSSMENSS
jgi:hypothetical protein